ncbi:hypothetical protein OG895_43140 [Streptomyces sp. NBC_00201]|uniref:hypothetical protein n=1 Tax=unclassified Streptomyces TaxID=2593676 RepID=UPI0022516A89|nr:MULTISPECIES: hypothetical protein [unclassified Streptomyces]MCX5063694.1 hypothetical protein [Streptomyces sp. NBC_00452]MCX5251849.1 hypothetical protein [Streptomyces sp. NBC_00201]MCX5294248.1 hypothetical protein [Streptomyces sp. NBC_00183]
MTSALVDEVDPYVLPMPTPDSPVVLDRWISPSNRHPNGPLRRRGLALGATHR